MAGTSFDIDIPVTGGPVADQASASLDTLASRLETASVAARAAADAMKAGERAYSQAETAADRAAKAVEKIGVAAAAQRGKIQEAIETGDTSGLQRAVAAAQKLNAAQLEAQKAADAAKASLASEAAALDKLKAAAAGAADAESKISKEIDHVKDAAKAAEKVQAAAAGSGKVNEIAEGFGKLGGPLGSMGQKAFGAAEGFKKLMASLGSAGFYVAIAVAVLAIAAAVVTATAAATAWAITNANAARSQMLLSDGIAGSVAGGRELDKTIKDLEKRVPQTTEELRNMAADLAKSGLKGQELADALEESAVKAAKLKWGPDFAKGANTLEKIGARLKGNITDLFAGPAVQGALDKLLNGLSLLASLFDTSNASGRAMQMVVEGVFGRLIGILAELVPKARSAFIQLEILVVKAAIAIKPYHSKLEEIGELLKEVGIVAAISFGILIATVLVVVAAVVAAVAALAWFYEGIVQGGEAIAAYGSKVVQGFVEAYDWVKAKLTEVGAFLSSISLVQMGMDLITGLADGIKGAASKVLEAITGAVSGAIDSAKKLLGIASPSKVFAEIGVQTAEGMASGVEGATGNVQSSLESMVAPPEAPAPGTKSSGGSGANISGNTFILQGIAGAEEAVSGIKGLLESLLEGDLTQLGGAVPDGA